jgi:hypothetical protein
MEKRVHYVDPPIFRPFYLIDIFDPKKDKKIRYYPKQWFLLDSGFELKLAILRTKIGPQGSDTLQALIFKKEYQAELIQRHLVDFRHLETEYELYRNDPPLGDSYPSGTLFYVFAYSEPYLLSQVTHLKMSTDSPPETQIEEMMNSEISYFKENKTKFDMISYYSKALMPRLMDLQKRYELLIGQINGKILQKYLYFMRQDETFHTFLKQQTEKPREKTYIVTGNINKSDFILPELNPNTRLTGWFYYNTATEKLYYWLSLTSQYEFKPISIPYHVDSKKNKYTRDNFRFFWGVEGIWFLRPNSIVFFKPEEKYQKTKRNSNKSTQGTINWFFSPDNSTQFKMHYIKIKSDLEFDINKKTKVYYSTDLKEELFVINNGSDWLSIRILIHEAIVTRHDIISMEGKEKIFPIITGVSLGIATDSHDPRFDYKQTKRHQFNIYFPKDGVLNELMGTVNFEATRDTGTFLSDWRPYADYKEFYKSNFNNAYPFSAFFYKSSTTPIKKIKRQILINNKKIKEVVLLTPQISQQFDFSETYANAETRVIMNFGQSKFKEYLNNKNPKIKNISACKTHVIIQFTDNSIWGWGDNTTNQLTSGIIKYYKYPVNINTWGEFDNIKAECWYNHQLKRWEGNSFFIKGDVIKGIGSNIISQFRRQETGYSSLKAHLSSRDESKYIYSGFLNETSAEDLLYSIPISDYHKFTNINEKEYDKHNIDNRYFKHLEHYEPMSSYVDREFAKYLIERKEYRRLKKLGLANDFEDKSREQREEEERQKLFTDTKKLSHDERQDILSFIFKGLFHIINESVSKIFEDLKGNSSFISTLVHNLQSYIQKFGRDINILYPQELIIYSKDLFLKYEDEDRKKIELARDLITNLNYVMYQVYDKYGYDIDGYDRLGNPRLEEEIINSEEEEL